MSMQRHVQRKTELVEGLDHGILVRGVDVAGSVTLSQPEDALDDRKLGSRSIKT
jgi:hypothetical protein